MPFEFLKMPDVAGTEGETQSSGAGDVGSMIGGAAGTFLGPLGTILGTGVGGMLGDQLFGSSGEQSKKFMDEAYAGTTPWERLGSSGGGAPGAVSGEKNMLRQQGIQNHMNQQTINNQKSLKEQELKNAKSIADNTNATALATTAANNQTAKYQADLAAKRINVLGSGFNTDPLASEIGKGWSWLKEKSGYDAMMQHLQQRGNKQSVGKPKYKYSPKESKDQSLIDSYKKRGG